MAQYARDITDDMLSELKQHFDGNESKLDITWFTDAAKRHTIARLVDIAKEDNKYQPNAETHNAIIRLVVIFDHASKAKIDYNWFETSEPIKKYLDQASEALSYLVRSLPITVSRWPNQTRAQITGGTGPNTRNRRVLTPRRPQG